MINIITGPEVVLVSVLNMILRLLSGYQKYPSGRCICGKFKLYFATVINNLKLSPLKGIFH